MDMQKFSLCDYLGDLPRIEVLDIGAIEPLGQEACYEKLVRAGRARVIGFEPDEAGCAKLNQRYGAPHRFFPSFVGDGQPARFYRTNVAFTGSLYRPNLPVLEMFEGLAEITTLVAEHDVATVRVDDIAEIDDVDFIHLDIQGGELKALTGAEKALAASVLIQTEVEFVELYEGQPLFADIDAHLRRRGFRFVDFIGAETGVMKPIKSPASSAGMRGLGQKLWADAVYIRDPRKLDEVSDVKLHKLALLLHDVYAAHDLAYFHLHAADLRRGEQLAQRYAERLFLRR
jgi:protein O-GlcNAc transferase